MGHVVSKSSHLSTLSSFPFLNDTLIRTGLNFDPKELAIFIFLLILVKKLKEFILDLNISLHQCFDLVNKQTNPHSYLSISSLPTKVFPF